MRLGISSAAAPDASLDELLTAATRRGLHALELRIGDAALACDDDGVAGDVALPGTTCKYRPLAASDVACVHRGLPQADAARAIAERIRVAGVRLTGVLVEPRGEWCDDDPRAMGAFSHAIGAPILVGGTTDIAQRVACAAAIRHCGGDALVLVAGDLLPSLAGSATTDAVSPGSADAVGRTRVPDAARLAWQVDPTCADPAASAAMLLARPGGLHAVRLVGGGPEATLQEGQGVGSLMRALALAAYDGDLILAPSSTRYRVVWSTWLGRRGGWGCGSAADSQVVLPIRTGALT